MRRAALQLHLPFNTDMEPEIMNATTPKSYAPEVIADSSGKWCGNGLRFATRAEAEANAMNLASRWTLVRDWRVVESDDEPNYRWDPKANGLVSL